MRIVDYQNVNNVQYLVRALPIQLIARQSATHKNYLCIDQKSKRPEGDPIQIFLKLIVSTLEVLRNKLQQNCRIIPKKTKHREGGL